MKEIKLEADIGNIDIVTDFINTELEALGCPLRARMQIDVAIDELFGNIARYAYGPAKGDALVRFDTEEEPLCAVITFIDRGKPFDPLKRDDPDVTLGVEEREIGGLGIFVVKKTMDAVDYRYQDGMNILTIRKRIG